MGSQAVYVGRRRPADVVTWYGRNLVGLWIAASRSEQDGHSIDSSNISGKGYSAQRAPSKRLSRGWSLIRKRCVVC